MKDLNEQVLSDLRRGVFDRARMGVPVGGAPHLHATLRALPDTDPANCKFWTSVLGTLFAESLGRVDELVVRTTIAALAEQLARGGAASTAAVILFGALAEGGP